MQEEEEKRMELLAKAAILLKEERLSIQELASRLDVAPEELEALEERKNPSG